MPTHKKTESECFKGPAKYLEYLVARALVTLLQRVPIGVAYRLGRVVGWLAWKCLARRRATVRKNLEIVNTWMDAQSSEGGGMMADSGLEINDSGGQINDSSSLLRHLRQTSVIPHPPSLAEQVKEVFQRAGANIFAGFSFARMRPEEAVKHIEIEGLQPLKSALAKGKGAIILLAHMGPWEALNQLPGVASLHDIEAPFGAMYRPLNNAYLDDWFKSQRESSGNHLFSRRDGFHKPVDFIRSGGMLGILADQKMREGPLASYFGVEVPTSPIPGLFHRRSGAPMLALSLATVAPARWKLTVTPVTFPAEVDLSSRVALASICNRALEQGLASSPCDGLWMHKRF